MKSYVFPGNISDDIMELGSEPFIYMRTDEFSDINKESEKYLLELVHAKNGRTIIYTGSGTGAMSAVVENYVTTRNKSIIINGGSFGKRWVSLCKYYNCEYYDFNVEFGRQIDFNRLEDTIINENPDTLLCQHHETSSGVLFDIKIISDLCKKYNISLIVDIISTFLAEEFNMDELQADICITSTQKGLNIPPGLSIIFLSEKLKHYKFNHNGYYWDFEDNLNNLSRGQTPFSPATILYLQLNKRLKEIISYPQKELTNISQVRENSRYFKKICESYGWEIKAENPSCAITGFQTKDTDRKIFKGLINKYNTYIMPGAIPGFYRVNHMGLQTKEDLNELAKQISELENS